MKLYHLINNACFNTVIDIKVILNYMRFCTPLKISPHQQRADIISQNMISKIPLRIHNNGWEIYHCNVIESVSANTRFSSLAMYQWGNFPLQPAQRKCEFTAIHQYSNYYNSNNIYVRAVIYCVCHKT